MAQPITRTEWNVEVRQDDGAWTLSGSVYDSVPGAREWRKNLIQIMAASLGKADAMKRTRVVQRTITVDERVVEWTDHVFDLDSGRQKEAADLH